jgi:hypothetical protein
MGRKNVDELIEKSISTFSKEIDVSRSVLERVTAFEEGRSRVPRILRSVLVSLSTTAGLVALFLYELVAHRYPSPAGGLNLGILKFFSQGFLLLVVVALFTVCTFYPSNRKHSQSTPSER